MKGYVKDCSLVSVLLSFLRGVNGMSQTSTELSWSLMVSCNEKNNLNVVLMVLKMMLVRCERELSSPGDKTDFLMSFFILHF